MSEERVPVASIVVGTRRRVDHGDIDGLAQSIRQHGLLHPVVLDDAGNLVAGERRLLACIALEWQTVPVRRLGSLSEDERRVIELEENLQRKDLTAYERSRTIVEMVETAKEIDRTELLPKSGNKSRGRPTEASDNRAADRVGIPQQTVSVARAHLRAVEQFPEVQDAPQSVAIDYAKAVEAEPELRASAPVEEIAEQARTRRLEERERRRQEQEISDRLLDALDTDGNIARARLRERFPRARHETTKNLLSLNPASLPPVLDEISTDLTRHFIGQARRWLDAMDHELQQGIHLVKREEQA